MRVYMIKRRGKRKRAAVRPPRKRSKKARENTENEKKHPCRARTTVFCRPALPLQRLLWSLREWRLRQWHSDTIAGGSCCPPERRPPRAKAICCRKRFSATRRRREPCIFAQQPRAVQTAAAGIAPLERLRLERLCCVQTMPYGLPPCTARCPLRLPLRSPKPTGRTAPQEPP